MSDWADWQQNRRLKEAEEALHAERRARSRLASQMKAQQGNLQAQIDRLTTALVALIEHEDIRAELGQYADAAAVRRFAREVVATVVVTGGAALRGSVEPADVPGYWLAAAARGVAATANDDPRGADLLAEAARRDPHLSATFLCLLGAQTRDARWSAGQLDRALPTLVGSPRNAAGPALATRAERQLWLAVADGRLDDPAADVPAWLAGQLADRVAEAGEASIGHITAWLEGHAKVPANALATEKAAQCLATLQTIVAPGRTTTEGRSDADADAEDGAEDPLADCLRSLVDEGSPAEGDIIDRMATVRADLGFLDERSASTAPEWSTPARKVIDLLLADLAQPPSTGRHRIARAALTPALEKVANELADQASQLPASTQDLTVAGTTIPVDATGAVGSWRDQVVASVVRRTPQPTWQQPAGLGLLGLGVVLIALALLSPAFALLGVLALFFGAGLAWSAFSTRRNVQAQVDSTTDRTEREIQRTAARIADETARSTTAVSQAQAYRNAIQHALASSLS